MKKLLNKNNILKGASVLLIATIMILSTFSATANTDETQELVPRVTKTGIEYLPQVKEVEPDGNRLEVILLEEGFEGGSIPAGWLNVDDDGDTYFWDVVFTDDGMPSHTGSYSAASASFINDVGPLTPDNWLITTAINLTGYDEIGLYYWVAAQDPDWSQEHLEVWISTTGTDIVDFTDEVDSFTIPAGSPDYLERSIALTSYIGETIYIAFRHCDVTDMFWIKIDDIKVNDIAPKFPDLDCDGSLSWTDVNPGDTVTDSFTVENIGDAGSELNWEIESYPDWGTWTITPDSGTGLTPEGSPVTIEVSVVAPDEGETEFTGEVKVVNSDDPDDFCIIDVSLVTPVSQQLLILQFLKNLAERFPVFAYLFAALL